MICRHCQKKPANRPRGLCWSCYYRPSVKEAYPSESKYARRVKADFHAPAHPCTPTGALPGTEEKIAVLEGRAERGEELFHARDAGWAGRGVPSFNTRR